MAKVKVATEGEVEKGKVKQVKIGGELVALYHTENDEWYATSDICTHEQCNLSYEGGRLQGLVAECDCHGGRFDIKTGAIVSPPPMEPLKTFKVVVEGQDIFVEA